MKKWYIFFLILICGQAPAQKKKANIKAPAEKLTAAQAQMSNDPKVIATFIKDNPGDPGVADLRIKLVQLITPANDIAAKPRVVPLTKGKLVKEVRADLKDGVNDKSKMAAKVLNHLFDNSPNKREAYVQIVNRSACNLIVKFSGKGSYYNLDVKANNQSYILIDKGNYLVTTSICDAKYSSAKNINKDIAITLRSGK
ncbi:hypothetical protein H1R16_06245 [Marnyiella aurantia]|uniref:DUF6759 domain-containing protein n=1 Tax=Marnyiella aurantia TaxID=2758037 RepID=A0A7D7QWV8_9FLAO|nr:DUF6759 domain-containing protein [Marnyiella aurantia]MBA5247764.1 hypothetical protein [Marnyiella aurantia]QMS97346.1 hypothetical protein H1R16_06245 [Marnyiella aurantia]